MSQDLTKTSETLPFLLEIGSEEIPARFVPTAMSHLEKAAAEAIAAQHLNWQSMRVVATPRRMALLIEGLCSRQPDREMEVKGPPVSVAFDTDGNPTPAAMGFAKKVGMSLDECQRGEDKRGQFLLARRTEVGRSAMEVLAEILPSLIKGIPFRKTMHWGNYDLDYARPLQWLVALLGNDVVDFKVDYLASGRQSRGHRTLSSDQSIDLEAPGSYFEALSSVGVMADHEERRRVIQEGLAKALADYDTEANLLEDDELLTEVIFLCEFPTPFLGTFGEEFLELPAQVVTTAMKSHQRYFSVQKKGTSELKPRFAAVRCGGRDHLDNVTAGNERVLRARLADALFYWEFDQKKTPDERVEMLGAVTWIEGFGTVLDKTRRIEGLSSWLWDHGLSSDSCDVQHLGRAATLCKSDLVSEMIKDGKEFTKLEGFIGSRYAQLAGEAPEVCQAIEEHFLPRSATGVLPADRLSAILSVADRLDNVAGCWLAGFVPTGAKDPYALRRHVLAVLRILLAEKVHLNLEAALTIALDQVRDYAGEVDLEEKTQAIKEFVKTRIQGFFVESQDQDPDVVRAVLPVRWRDPADALEWIQALTHFRDRDDFQLLATGFKRCRNILKGDILPMTALDSCLGRWNEGGQGAAGEDFAQMPDSVEQELWQKVAGAAKDLVKLESQQDYNGVFATLSGLGPDIDKYFDQVRVNADEENLKALRHAFLREIHGLFARFADFTEVAVGEK